MKLWQKDSSVKKEVEVFTVGRDKEFDFYMAEFDVLGSMAHVTMLESINLVTKAELTILLKELQNILNDIRKGNFKIEEGIEDVHSQVELLLTRKLGDVGKKIHSGRSRNDQVLVDLKLYMRSELTKTVERTQKLFDQLISLSEKHKDKLMPGYTHLQVAMPSSFGLWFGAYAESLIDDMELLLASYKIVNKNPLGSAAGYGSSFPLNRQMTTGLLGFETLNHNVVYAQMSRGKTEKIVSIALASVAATLSKLAMDACLFMNQNFGFIYFPDELTTGSSIMPHKKNPDVFELIRAKCNRLQALPNELTLLINNLPSGYHRDMQLTKESLFPAFKEISDCTEMMMFMLEGIKIKDNILADEKYKYIFSVEAVNELVLSGIPFRDAYKKVGAEIENKTFAFNKPLQHTHEGSIGNLSNDKIAAQMKNVVQQFNFSKTDTLIKQLISA